MGKQEIKHERTSSRPEKKEWAWVKNYEKCTHITPHDGLHRSCRWPLPASLNVASASVLLCVPLLLGFKTLYIAAAGL